MKLSILAAALLATGVRSDAATFPVTVFTDTMPNAYGSPAGAGDGPGVRNDLRNTILLANSLGGTNTITFVCPISCKIVLNAPLPPITSNLTIDGGTFGEIVIDGKNAYRVFFADTGTITLANLQIQNARATGGPGGDGAYGGGGGAGFGAGLFVNQSSANVTILSTYFSNCSVTGGYGGGSISSSGAGGGGGGGLAFPGGSATFGGDLVYNAGGGGGGVTGPGMAAVSSGAGGNGGNGGNGGGGGGAGASGGSGDGAGGSGYATDSGGGGSSLPFSPDMATGRAGAGGFGGGGGGGGGGFGTQNVGGPGGFGGGSGGGYFGYPGGFGGGAGGYGFAYGTPIVVGGIQGGMGGFCGGWCTTPSAAPTQQVSGGGGGAAAGPAIFVATGTLTIQNSGGVTFEATAGEGFQGGTDGTADATAVFNYGGTVNGSQATGALPNALPIGGMPAYTLNVVSSLSVTAGTSHYMTVTPIGFHDAQSSSTDYNGTVHFTSSDPSAVLPADTTFVNGLSPILFFTLNTTGNQTITATDRLQPSISGTAYLTVNPGPQTITFSPAITTYTLANGSFTVSATASSGLAVSFASTTASVCAVSGTTVTLLSVGTCIIQATQPGNSTYTAAAPVSANFTISLAGQTIAFSPAISSYAITAGSFTVSATASSGRTVSFASTTTLVCTVLGTTVTLRSVGTCIIQATQPGDSIYASAAPVSASFTITLAGQTISFSPAVTSYSLSAGSFTVSATSSSSLNVSFASTTGTVCTISGTTVTLLTPGTCTIQATQAGNSTYAAATPVPVSFAISPSSQTITFNPAVTSYMLSSGSFAVSATASSSLTVSFASTTGTVCTVSGTTVTLLTPGTCTIQATQAGNSNYSAATPVSVNFTITTLTPQSITFSPAVTSYSLSAGTFAVSATASSGLAVSFASTTRAVCTISGTTVTLLTPGTCTIQATQAGNPTYAAATPVSVSFAIAPSAQTITFSPAVTSYSLLAGTFTVSATATSSLAVSFASLTTATCTVSGSTVTMTAGGTCTIQATQAGNANYSAAAPVSVNFTITALTPQTITFGALPTHTYSDTFTLSATATSGLTVTFSAVSGPCSVSGTRVTVTGAGICTIAANQPGNGTYSAAPTVTQAFSGNKAVLTVTANNATAVQGSALPVFTATITGFLNGDTSSVVSGAPGLTTTATASSPAGTYPIVASAGTLSAANYVFNPVNGTLTITAPAPSFLVNPNALTLQCVQGVSAGLTRAFTVFSNLGGTPFNVASSAAWLVAPPIGMTGSGYSVSVNPAGLAAGSYQATLRFTQGNNLVQVPVSLTVLPAPVLSVQPTAVGFTGTYGTTALSTQAAQLTSTSVNVPFTASGDEPWVTVTSSGTTPAALQISANPSGLGSAVYQGVVTVTAAGASNSPLTIPVRFAVTGGTSGILNAASGTAGTATPDTLLTVPAPAACAPNQQILVNGVPATVLSATSSQTEFAVPEGIGSGSTATVQVLCGGSPVETATLPQAYTNPGIFTTGGGSSQGKIVNSDGTTNAASNPAARGSAISVYMTGCGTLYPPDSNGLQLVMYAVAATIGGFHAEVTFAGQAPGEPLGVQQVNLVVPPSAPLGPNVPILVTVGGITSPAGATVAIQ